MRSASEGASSALDNPLPRNPAAQSSLSMPPCEDQLQSALAAILGARDDALADTDTDVSTRLQPLLFLWS